ncbi:unnamed protein product [Allacma fusca]|uniref:Uncharacterized protein n=1 Tax=Allacma fusca TaxID=39272 RepID=A0A8J2NM70_9HEXA|nr:unnamed protein product [Allacma fusca]
MSNNYILDHKVQRRKRDDRFNDDLDANAPPVNYRCSTENSPRKSQRFAKILEPGLEKLGDDLYSEVLHTLSQTLNPKGKESKKAASLVEHLQQAFNIDGRAHKKLFDAVQQRTTPLVANVEVIEAKDLRGKDANGLSDPYCRLFVSPKQKFTTTVKPATLTPVWKEHFTIPVKSYQDGILTFEVWDYDDPEESISDKMNKIKEVKSARGIKNFMKEIAFSASTGKEPGDFMGSLKMPLKNIPSDGFENWFQLDYFSIDFHAKPGQIYLRVIIAPEKDKTVVTKEYRRILQVLVIHELKQNDEKNIPWGGELSEHSECILKQLRLQGALRCCDINLAKFYVYTHAHYDHCLNAKLFPAILSAIVESQKYEEISADDMKIFWIAAETFLDNFYDFMLNNFGCIFKNLPGATQAYHLLSSLELLKDMSLLAEDSGRHSGNKITKEFIIQKAEESISAGAEELFNSIYNNATGENCEAVALLKTGEYLIADLSKREGLLDMVSKEFLGVHYCDLTYRMYDKKYGECIKSFLDKLGTNKPSPMGSQEEIKSSQENDAMGKNLFELYHKVKLFSESSGDMVDTEGLSIKESYHKWFHSSVGHWLEEAWREAYQRMERAVQLDVLRPVSNCGDESKLTTSAVDTKLIFTQIIKFWDQLAWSCPEDCFTFIMKLLDDFCKCIINYNELMTQKINQLKRNEGVKFQLYDELCYAINNIEHIAGEMTQISKRLGTEKILNELEKVTGSQAARCQRTLELVLENVYANIASNTCKIIEKLGSQMHPAIVSLLVEDVDATIQEGSKLCEYLDKSLGILIDKTLSECFNKIFAVIWEKTSSALKSVTLENVEKQRPEVYFQKIQRIMEEVQHMFFPDGLTVVGSASSHNADLQEVEALTKIHGAPSADLMLLYAKERLQQQGAMKTKIIVEHGVLTFRTAYCEENETLHIEILNCRDLKPYDSNGLDDPYVKFHIIPHEKYPNIKKKTAVKKKTLFPLFDETFVIPLTRKERSLGGIIRFAVKDYDLFGKNDFIGEAFQALESVRSKSPDTELQVLPQTSITLSKPDRELESMLQSLETRIYDPLALKFARKERAKQAGANA